MLFGEKDVIPGLRDRGLFTPGPDFRIGAFVFALRAKIMGKVGDVEQQLVLPRLGSRPLMVKVPDAIPELLHLSLDPGTVFAPRSKGADLPRGLLALRLKLLLLGLGPAAGFVAGENLVDQVG